MTGRDCYSHAERCNGIAECVTWVDEMNCPVNSSDIPDPLRPIDSFSLLYRLWNDGEWLWHSTFVKWVRALPVGDLSVQPTCARQLIRVSVFDRPDGQIQFNVPLPKMNADWVTGAFSVDRELGLSLMQQPHIFSGIRRFYMTVEVPEEAVWGEQLGVRVCLFNNWNYWVEVSRRSKKLDYLFRCLWIMCRCDRRITNYNHFWDKMLSSTFWWDIIPYGFRSINSAENINCEFTLNQGTLLGALQFCDTVNLQMKIINDNYHMNRE